MISTFIVIVIIGVILTVLTAKMKKLCGYIAFLCILLINVLIVITAIDIFRSQSPLVISGSFFSLPAIGANLSVSIDNLSMIFLILIGFISLIATLYSIDYMGIYKGENLIRFYPFLILFVAGMIGVVCVSDLFFFFVFWEFMTLTSYVLVIYEKDDATVLKAGFKYFLMTHIGTALLFTAGIILQSYTGSFSFENIGKALNHLSSTNPILLVIVLALFFIGFATKAGVYPFGTWLPDAHPAAPSGVSAILSGVMIKLGIYGILRVFLYMLDLSAITGIDYGIAIATFGVISIIMGSIGALIQKDYKRLFAYSSIGQIGYIVMAIGIGLSFTGKGYPLLAAIAILAGLLHLINHAFFKSLLFLNCGSILYKTGTRNLNEVGGLSNLMKYTTITAMIGALSIMGLPLFSGFASKWLIYEISILGGIKLPLYILYGVIAIFFSVLTMAYCVKFLSSAFLGSIPSKLNHLDKNDVPLTMKISQAILAVFCILFGIIPLTPLFFVYASLLESKLGSNMPSFDVFFGIGRNGISLMINENTIGAFRPLLIALVFFVCIILSYLIFRSGRAKKRAVDVWYCGEEYSVDSVRYRSQSFYDPIVTLFETRFFPKISTPSLKKPEKIYKLLDFDRLFYYPFFDFILNITKKFRKTHVGTPQIYMLWVVIGIIIVVLSLFLFAR